jgi:hypothetical protein
MKLTLEANPNPMTRPFQALVFSGKLTTGVGSLQPGVPNKVVNVYSITPDPIESNLYWPVGQTKTKRGGGYSLKCEPGHPGKYVAFAVNPDTTVIAHSNIVTVRFRFTVPPFHPMP